MSTPQFFKIVRVLLILVAFVLLCGFKDCSKKTLVVIRYRPIANFKKYVPVGRTDNQAFANGQMMMMYQIISIENDDPGAVSFTFKMANVYADGAVMLTGAQPSANLFPAADDRAFFTPQSFKDKLWGGWVNVYEQNPNFAGEHLTFVLALNELGAGEEYYVSPLEYKKDRVRGTGGSKQMVVMVQDPVSTCVCYQDTVFMSGLLRDGFKGRCKITNKRTCESCFTSAECQNCSPTDACTVAIAPKFVPAPAHPLPPSPPRDGCVSARNTVFCFSMADANTHLHVFYDGVWAANSGEAICELNKRWPHPQYEVHAQVDRGFCPGR